ncbi:helix-turn-helix domain-containing protein [Nocardia sp. R6R-6]|uniref:helix-turn-helix domain-containing protein n=1 Tax=Nocardia sp. R6R-6 TaxID=3459303 RepID=UPI00403DF3B8
MALHFGRVARRASFLGGQVELLSVVRGPRDHRFEFVGVHGLSPSSMTDLVGQVVASAWIGLTPGISFRGFPRAAVEDRVVRGMSQDLTIGERVAWYRRRRGMSQGVLAGLVGRTDDWVGKIENNRIPLDRLSILRLLADALDVSLGDLIGEPTLLDWTNDSGASTVPALRAALMDFAHLIPALSVPADDTELPDFPMLERDVAEVFDDVGFAIDSNSLVHSISQVDKRIRSLSCLPPSRQRLNRSDTTT